MDKLNNEVKKLMIIWLEKQQYNIRYSIVDIKSVDFEDKIGVFIETHLPGLTIGKQGSNINKLKEILERNLEREVIISLDESKLWNINYNIEYKPTNQ